MSGRRVSFQEPVAEDKAEVLQRTDSIAGTAQPPSPESPPFPGSLILQPLGEDAELQESLAKGILPTGTGGGGGVITAGICGVVICAVVFILVFLFLAGSSNKQKLHIDRTTTEQAHSSHASTSVELFNFSDIAPRVNDTMHRRGAETVSEESTEVQETR